MTDTNEKVVEMKEALEQEAVVETKPKFKDRAKAWVKRNKKKILIVTGAALAVGGAAVAKMYKGHKDESAAQAEQAQLTQIWYQRGLLEAHGNSNTETENAIETEYTPVDEV